MTKPINLIIKDYLDELKELREQIAIDCDLMSDLATSYCSQYPEIPHLYINLMTATQGD